MFFYRAIKRFVTNEGGNVVFSYVNYAMLVAFIVMGIKYYKMPSIQETLDTCPKCVVGGGEVVTIEVPVLGHCEPPKEQTAPFPPDGGVVDEIYEELGEFVENVGDSTTKLVENTKDRVVETRERVFSKKRTGIHYMPIFHGNSLSHGVYLSQDVFSLFGKSIQLGFGVGYVGGEYFDANTFIRTNYYDMFYMATLGVEF